jgi:hypothetical protein
MATKGVLTLTRKSLAIEDAALVHQGVVTSSLARKFSTPPVVPEDGEVSADLAAAAPVPDWQVLQDFIARELENGRRLLLETANAYEREVQDDAKKKVEREAVVTGAYDQLVRVRQALEAAVGNEKALDILGLTGATPQQPDTLLERMREASIRLRDAKRLPEELLVPGMTQSWTGLAQALDLEADRLEELLGQQRRERRRAEEALVRKDEAQALFNNTYVGFTKILDGLYTAADQRQLAARLRRSLRRSSGNGGGSDGGGSNGEEPEVTPVEEPPGSPDGADEEDLVPADRDGPDLRPIVALLPGAVSPPDGGS